MFVEVNPKTAGLINVFKTNLNKTSKELKRARELSSDAFLLEIFLGLFRFFPPADYSPPQSKL